MSLELIIRHVLHYGWLPIVREFNTETGQTGRELYRGEFRKTVAQAVKAAQPYLAETK